MSITDGAAGVMSALVMSALVVLDYDSAKLDADYLDVALGAMLSELTGHAAWTLTTNVDDAAGRITVLGITAVPLSCGPGELLQITFHARGLPVRPSLLRTTETRHPKVSAEEASLENCRTLAHAKIPRFFGSR